MCERFNRAYRYMLENARLLERRAFEVRFLGAPPASVAAAVKAYQNADGGLGHGLEPDIRCPDSQPLFCEYGLNTLYEVQYRDPELAISICKYLASVADERGLLPPIFDSVRKYPVAAHWGGPISTGLNPTLGLCGAMYYHGVEHEWLNQATQSCIEGFCNDPAPEAHLLLGAARLAENLPDSVLANRLAELIANILPQANFFIPHAPVKGYGLTPLHFAPMPHCKWRTLFSDKQIEGHLDDLINRQKADGGWPVTWAPPDGVAEFEWRGRVTLEAVAVLVAYKRISIAVA